MSFHDLKKLAADALDIIRLDNRAEYPDALVLHHHFSLRRDYGRAHAALKLLSCEDCETAALDLAKDRKISVPAARTAILNIASDPFMRQTKGEDYFIAKGFFHDGDRLHFAPSGFRPGETFDHMRRHTLKQAAPVLAESIRRSFQKYGQGKDKPSLDVLSYIAFQCMKEGTEKMFRQAAFETAHPGPLHRRMLERSIRHIRTIAEDIGTIMRFESLIGDEYSIEAQRSSPEEKTTGIKEQLLAWLGRSSGKGRAAQTSARINKSDYTHSSFRKKSRSLDPDVIRDFAVKR